MQQGSVSEGRLQLGYIDRVKVKLTWVRFTEHRCPEVNEEVLLDLGRLDLTVVWASWYELSLMIANVVPTFEDLKCPVLGGNRSRLHRHLCYRDSPIPKEGAGHNSFLPQNKRLHRNCSQGEVYKCHSVLPYWLEGGLATFVQRF
jgi:hypothetical protein